MDVNKLICSNCGNVNYIEKGDGCPKCGATLNLYKTNEKRTKRYIYILDKKYK